MDLMVCLSLVVDTKVLRPHPSPKFSNTFCILDRVSVWDGFALELIIEELMMMRYSFF